MKTYMVQVYLDRTNVFFHGFTVSDWIPKMDLSYLLKFEIIITTSFGSQPLSFLVLKIIKPKKLPNPTAHWGSFRFAFAPTQK